MSTAVATAARPSVEPRVERTAAHRAVEASLAARLGRPVVAAEWDRALSDLGFDADAVLGLLVDLEDELGVVVENEHLRPGSLDTGASLAELFAARLAARPRTSRARFVHLTSEFLPHVSGPAMNVWDLCHHLGDLFDFEVYSYDLDRGLPPRDVQEGVRVRRFRVPRYTDLVRVRRRFRAVAARPELDAEAVCSYEMESSEILRELAHSGADGVVSWFYAGVLGPDLVELLPSKRWLMVPYFFQPPGGRAEGGAWWDPERLDRMMLFQEHDLRKAVEWGVPREKLVLVPMPVDTARFRPLGLERDRDTLLYVGRITPNKGLTAFLETFRWMTERRPGLRFRVIADLDSPSPLEQREQARLREAIGRLGLSDRVELAGRRDGEELVREMSSHAIHVLPSNGDCYSKVTVEALACGMTCVNLDGSYAEWQRRRDGDEPLVHLRPDLPSMGATILDLLDRDELPSHRDHIVNHMSWEAVRDVYSDFLLS